jgi:hypothetical protein
MCPTLRRSPTMPAALDARSDSSRCAATSRIQLADWKRSAQRRSSCPRPSSRLAHRLGVPRLDRLPHRLLLVRLSRLHPLLDRLQAKTACADLPRLIGVGRKRCALGVFIWACKRGDDSHSSIASYKDADSQSGRVSVDGTSAHCGISACQLGLLALG